MYACAWGLKVGAQRSVENCVFKNNEMQEDTRGQDRRKLTT